MASSVKAPKFGLVSSIIPDVWLFKLKSLVSRSVKKRGTLNTPKSEPVAADQLAPFLPKTVQNCYKHTSPSGLPPSKPTEVTTPDKRTESDTSISRNGNQFLDDAYLTQSTSKRSFIVTPVVTSCKTPGSQITVSSESPSSLFDRLTTYNRSTALSLKNMHKFGGDQLLTIGKGNARSSFRKVGPINIAWLLPGCGNAPCRQVRHGSFDMENESKTELEAAVPEIEPSGVGNVYPTWPKTAGSREHATTWSLELTNGEVLKKQMVITQGKFGNGWVGSESSFRDLRSRSGIETGSLTPSSCINEIEPDFGHKVSPRRLSSSTNETTRGSRDPPWSFAYLSGTDTTNVSSFELGIRKNRSMWSTTSDSEAAFNRETENGNVSDTQSVLRARILAAERLREGSNFSSREHKKKDNVTSKREESTALVDSVKSVLEQRRQKSLLLEEEELEQACCRLSTHGSPALGVHNTPVFESFLEVSAKGRSLNLPAGATRVRVDDSSTSSARELHCINVESPSQTTRPQGQAHEFCDCRPNRGGREARGSRNFTNMRRDSACRAKKRTHESKESIKSKKWSSRHKSKESHGDRSTSHPHRAGHSMENSKFQECDFTPDKQNVCRNPGSRRRSSKEYSRSAALNATATAAAAPEEAMLDMTIIPNELHGLVKESVALVKSSYDPYKDFRESMIEMIVEKDIQETGDLEELLQCYLSLNEVEYHTVIVNVFTDVWRELFGNYS
jgi:uncharacterized protein (TIGR01568 family)